MTHKIISCFTIPLCLFLFLCPFVHMYPFSYTSQLDYNFYDRACPRLSMIVRYNIWAALKNDTRMAASLLRMHFHDCIVNVAFLSFFRLFHIFMPFATTFSNSCLKGCDGSVLLDDTDDFKGEKNAPANRNSLRGFEVIDSIKADVEKFCPSTVSCADILTLAAREAVVLAGGPFWPVPLGRRDATTASVKGVNEQIPSPFEPLANITAKFTSKGLDIKDVVVLSGGHTLGFAQCFTFKRRLFNFDGLGNPDPTLDSSALSSLRRICPKKDEANSNVAPLDSTNVKFDNTYYTNLVQNTGLLESDQALVNDPNTAAMVNSYSGNPFLFNNDFAASMVKLGNVGVLTGTKGQIRKKCGTVN